MNDTLMTVFGWIGIATIAGGLLVFAYCAFDALMDVIHSLRWLHTYKHRFDKPPTAACYCNDCKYHGTKYPNGANPCNFPGVNRWTPDTGFCYEAEPITVKEAEKRALN